MQPTNGVGRPQPHHKTTKCLGVKKSCHNDQSNHHNTVAPAATNTKVHWHTIEFSHNTRTHTTKHTRISAPACAASRNPNTTTSQTQTHATHWKTKTVKESPPQPPTQPTTRQPLSSYQAGCLGDDKKHYTPHPHTTNPQHTPTKHTNTKQKRDRTRDPFPTVTTSAI